MWADYHEFGGDPCNKTRKYIEVHYYCHDGTEGIFNKADRIEQVRLFSGCCAADLQTENDQAKK